MKTPRLAKATDVTPNCLGLLDLPRAHKGRYPRPFGAHLRERGVAVRDEGSAVEPQLLARRARGRVSPCVSG